MRCKGYSATELLVVVIIVGIIAAASVPRFSASDSYKLDLAATRVAEAIRFARSESMRTGRVHGITISQTTQRVRVREYDVSTDPVSPTVTARHPLSKQPYDFDFDEEPTTLGVLITNTQDVFDYNGLGRRRTVLFDVNGVPMWMVASGPATYNLSLGAVALSMGAAQRNVGVAPYTGRVSIL